METLHQPCCYPEPLHLRLASALAFKQFAKHMAGTIKRLRTLHHGIISEILDLNFRSLGRRATWYHSLEVYLDDNSKKSLEAVAIARSFNNEKHCYLTSIKHRYLPLWGVQYHPESVYSELCEVVVYDFLLAASTRRVERENHPHARNECSELETADRNHDHSQTSCKDIIWDQIRIDGDFFESVKLARSGDPCFFLLDSSLKSDWSFFNLSATAKTFHYSLRTRIYNWKQAGGSGKSWHELRVLDSHKASLDYVWQHLKDFSLSQKFRDGPSHVPFWGGLLRYFS